MGEAFETSQIRKVSWVSRRIIQRHLTLTPQSPSCQFQRLGVRLHEAPQVRLVHRGIVRGVVRGHPACLHQIVIPIRLRQERRRGRRLAQGEDQRRNDQQDGDDEEPGQQFDGTGDHDYAPVGRQSSLPISGTLAVPVVPSLWTTTEAAALASSRASPKLAPTASATVRLADTASPAPTTSISPRTGRAGAYSTWPFAAAPIMPRAARVTKTLRPFFFAKTAAAASTCSGLNSPGAPVNEASSAAFILNTTGGKPRNPRRLSARISSSGFASTMLLIAARTFWVTTPVSGISTWSSTMMASTRAAASCSWLTRSPWSHAEVGVQFLRSRRLSSTGGLFGSTINGLQ